MYRLLGLKTILGYPNEALSNLYSTFPLSCSAISFMYSLISLISRFSQSMSSSSVNTTRFLLHGSSFSTSRTSASRFNEDSKLFWHNFNQYNYLQAQCWRLTLECRTNTAASIVFKRFPFPSPEFGKCHRNWLGEGAGSWLGEECYFDRFWATEFGVCRSRNWGAGSSLGDECRSDCLQATGE